MKKGRHHATPLRLKRYAFNSDHKTIRPGIAAQHIIARAAILNL